MRAWAAAWLALLSAAGCDSGPALPDCKDACGPEGALECAGSGWRECRAVGACLAWGAISPCPEGQACHEGACRRECADGCSEAGATRCSGAGVQTCVADAHGCLAWGAATPCAGGWCDPGRDGCVPCHGTCDEAGATRCQGLLLQSCVPDAHGCLFWDEPQACTGGWCGGSPAACVPCENGCDYPAATRCEGWRERTCVADAKGCLVWSEPASCAGGWCDASQNRCTPCAHGCEQGAARCPDAHHAQRCVADERGCLGWAAPDACTDGYCDGDQHECVACAHRCPAPGATRCDGLDVQVCAADAVGCRGWSATRPCENGKICDEDTGACVSAGCGLVPTAGRCKDPSTIELCAVPTGGGGPAVRTVACAPDESCAMVGGAATCRLAAACREGRTFCADAGTLRTCAGGQWSGTACPNGCRADNPLGAFCRPAVASTTLSGTFSFAARVPHPYPRGSDWGSVYAAPGIGFLVTSLVDASGGGSLQPLDVVRTGAGGAFSIQVPQSPRAGDVLHVSAVGAGPDGALAYVVADPGFAAAGRQELDAAGASPRVWSWTWRLAALPAGNALYLSEADGSGAATVFHNIRRSHEVATTRLRRGGHSLAVWVGLGTTWSCGACFAPWGTTKFGETFQSQIWIPGGPDKAYYADAVVAHELGHWVMSSYGRSPDEGGRHVLGVPTFPGQAWSEGFATWFSSDVRNSPVYADKQDGSMFWFDLAARDYSRWFTSWARPVAGAGLLQKIDENEVAAMAWTLSRSSAAAAQSLYDALAAPSMNGTAFGRGYTRHTWDVDDDGHQINVRDLRISKPCFADFLDALDCAGFPRDAIDAATNPATAYPYPSATPICSSGCSSASCAGCCQNGACLAGRDVAACGANGSACLACNAGQACTNGACTGGTCSAANCPSGCCTGTACVSPPTDGYCGTGGAVCRACPAGQACSQGACRGREGTACSATSPCLPGLVCLKETLLASTCRAACNPAAPTCAPGWNCVSVGGSSGCLPAPSATSRWKIVFVEATVRRTDPNDNNSAWDPSDGAPDPYVQARIAASGHEWEGAAVPNTFVAYWNQTSEEDFAWSELASVRFRIYDEDTILDPDDLMDTYQADVRPPWAGNPWTFTWDHSGLAGVGSDSLTIQVVPAP